VIGKRFARGNVKKRTQMRKQLFAAAAAVVLSSGIAFAQTYPPSGSYGETSVSRHLSPNGNVVTKKKIQREGIAGSSVTHVTKRTNPYTGSTTTRSTTTHMPD
jgi:hypothetical protein